MGYGVAAAMVISAFVAAVYLRRMTKTADMMIYRMSHLMPRPKLVEDPGDVRLLAAYEVLGRLATASYDTAKHRPRYLAMHVCEGDCRPNIQVRINEEVIVFFKADHMRVKSHNPNWDYRQELYIDYGDPDSIPKIVKQALIFANLPAKDKWTPDRAFSQVAPLLALVGLVVFVISWAAGWIWLL